MLNLTNYVNINLYRARIRFQLMARALHPQIYAKLNVWANIAVSTQHKSWQAGLQFLQPGFESAHANCTYNNEKVESICFYFPKKGNDTSEKRVLLQYSIALFRYIVLRPYFLMYPSYAMTSKDTSKNRASVYSIYVLWQGFLYLVLLELGKIM